MQNSNSNLERKGSSGRLLLVSIVSLFRRRGFVEISLKAFNLWRREGWPGIYHRLATLGGSYKQWIKLYDSLNSYDRAKIHHHIHQFVEKPTISILLPTLNSSERGLRTAIYSVLAQLYPHWELCVAVDASFDKDVRGVVEECARLDARIRVFYHASNVLNSNVLNGALKLARGQFVGLLEDDDVFAEDALYMFAWALNEDPKLNLVFSDEDKIGTDGRRFEPYFKPDWNPELMRCQNATGHLSVYRTELVRALGGFNQGFEGNHDWDLALRVSDKVPPSTIRHIPRVLYHSRVKPDLDATGSPVKPYVVEARRRIVREHLDRCQLIADVLPCPQRPEKWHRVRYALPAIPPLVSIIVPTRNGLHLLKRCIDTLLKLTDYPNLEVIVADNQSDDPHTLQFLNEKFLRGEIRICHYNAPFNYSAINNEAVTRARGEILCFLNNDIEICEGGWLTELVSHAVRPGIGAVGARLLYPDGRIQHAGVILGIGGVAAHIYIGSAGSENGCMGRAVLQQNLSVVTAACMVVARAAFDRAQGFDEVNLPVSFNDVDFCLRLEEAGYQNIWTPYATLIHHESATRGKDDTPAKKLRASREIAYMQRQWSWRLQNDPAFNPNFSLDYTFPKLSFPPRIERPWRLQCCSS